jgi:hypothetical protein
VQVVLILMFLWQDFLWTNFFQRHKARIQPIQLLDMLLENALSFNSLVYILWVMLCSYHFQSVNLFIRGH